jgi:hypothetical protein
VGEVKRVVVFRDARPRAGNAKKLHGASERTSLTLAEQHRDRGLTRVPRSGWFVPRV